MVLGGDTLALAPNVGSPLRKADRVLTSSAGLTLKSPMEGGSVISAAFCISLSLDGEISMVEPCGGRDGGGARHVKGVEGERLMGVHELVDFREFVRVAIVSSQSASGGGSGDGDSMRRIS